MIVANKSLKLPRGKLAAQVAHAVAAAFLVTGDEARRAWLADGMPKIVLKDGARTNCANWKRQPGSGRFPRTW